MRRKPFIKILISILIMVVGPTLALAATASTTTVEFSSAIHFLNPAGDDIEVGPGIYEVEAAGSWLKLVPEGQGRTEAVLLEATAGTHDEPVTEPAVRLEGEAENPDVFHLALLLADGTGLEAIGTTSGIRPRGLNLAFLSKATQGTRKFTQRPRVSQKSLPSLALSPDLNLPKLGGKVVAPPSRPRTTQRSCGPRHAVIPGSLLRNGSSYKLDWVSQPHLAVLQNQLHLVVGSHFRCGRFKSCLGRLSESKFSHFRLTGGRWEEVTAEQKRTLGYIDEGTSMALRSFDRNLWAVWKDDGKQLWYSRYNGQWAPKTVIPGQYSKSTPAMLFHRNRLHMVHQGKTSDDLWHSFFSLGNGWSKNVKVGQRSHGTPGFVSLLNGDLRLVYRESSSSFSRGTRLFDSRGGTGIPWQSPKRIDQAESQDTPIVIQAYGDRRGHGLMVHRGKSTNRLWSTLYGQSDPQRPTLTWYDDRPLLQRQSDGPVALARYQGCFHMVYKKGKTLIHTTMSLKDAHPDALK